MKDIDMLAIWRATSASERTEIRKAYARGDGSGVDHRMLFWYARRLLRWSPVLLVLFMVWTLSAFLGASALIGPTEGSWQAAFFLTAAVSPIIVVSVGVIAGMSLRMLKRLSGPYGMKDPPREN